MQTLHDLIRIDASLTFAILPYCSHSTEAATVLHAKGKEVILHLPMEPLAYPDEQPGPGALFLNMSNEAIRRQVDKNISAVPFVTGVNNHMGSIFMADGAKLSVVLNQLKKKHLFFVDSRTTSSSKAEQIALKSGVPYISRKIFIDTEKNFRTTLQKLMKLNDRDYGKNSEPILVIGHPYPDTIRALREAVPALKTEGVDIVPVSYLVK